ncbi:MAG: hypothetical protein CBARDCOR_6356 [uncultured Caballeronia sp.]|nr:MAG: hypothetical protein CBARDCOR_6356 [uncultured Caballeronia sp.]
MKLIQGDVTSFEAGHQAIDACIHAATDFADLARAGDALRVFDTSVTGTCRVLDFAQVNGASRSLLT